MKYLSNTALPLMVALTTSPASWGIVFPRRVAKRTKSFHSTDHSSEDLSESDLTRAKLPYPPEGSPVLSKEGNSVESTLNDWLVKNVPSENLRRCESYADIAELNHAIKDLFEFMNPDLQDIYESGCDTPRGCDKRGVITKKSLTEYEAVWQEESARAELFSDEAVKKAVTDVLRDGKCFEAVLLFSHHLSSSAQSRYIDDHGLAIPLLPENKDSLHFLSSVYIKGQNRRRLEITDAYHAHSWDGDAADYRQFYHNQTLTELESEELAELLASYNTQSPCQMAHQVIAKNWTAETAIQAGISPDRAEFYAESIRNDTFNKEDVNTEANTTIPDTGYIDCDQVDTCLAGGDQKYMLRAVVRAHLVKGTKNIKPSGSNSTFGQDVVFHTRTFEGMEGSPSKWGPNKAGGNGTSGLLGPAFQASPGQKVHIFVKNDLGDTSAVGPDVNTAKNYWDRIQIIREVKNNTNLSFAPYINYTGPEWQDDEYPLNVHPPVNYTEMTLGVGEENLPGFNTSGFDIFNIHMHGWEVAPHLFYPPGTSDPKADWISISPAEVDPGKQCMCYHLAISETQSRGDFIYHTHRHGTTTMLTWGGMFGLSLTGEENVTEVRDNPSGPATLTRDLVNISDAEGLNISDDDVHYVVIYDSQWNYAEGTASDGQTEFVLSDFLNGSRAEVDVHAFFVNNEYQPTIEARTGTLSVFRVVCVSAGMICAFQILEGDGTSPNSTIIPFDRVASDGISYMKPVHRRATGNPLIPDVTNSEAYLSMGGGMREVVVVQFPRNGTYTIWQRSCAFDDGFDQLLMTVNVVGEEAEVKSIEGYSLASGREPISDTRNVSLYRGYTFGTTYNQGIYPFPWYGVGDINGVNVSAFDLDQFDIGLPGGGCGIWVIRSKDINLHPFHIHVNPFMVISQSSHWEDNPDLNLFLSDYTLPFDSVNGTALTGIWRDTAWVPPYGYLVIKQCYDAGVRPPSGGDVETFGGKFVFHCHFLVHEDTGLIRNVILSSNKSSPTTPTTPPTDPPTSSGIAWPFPTFVSGACVAMVAAILAPFI